MAECIAAEIWIGGKLPLSLATGLCRAIAEQDVSLGWGGSLFKPYSAADLVGAKQDRRTGKAAVDLLRLCDDKARWGVFDSLEPFLREHGIPYTRISEGIDEFDPETIEFRPGMEEPVLIWTSVEGLPTVLAFDLAPVDASLTAALERIEKGSAAPAAESVREAQRQLRKQLPPELPPLEPFEIEQGED